MLVGALDGELNVFANPPMLLSALWTSSTGSRRAACAPPPAPGWSA
ncbi:hypothetical protein [Streptomyces sp. NPDC086519]